MRGCVQVGGRGCLSLLASWHHTQRVAACLRAVTSHYVIALMSVCVCAVKPWLLHTECCVCAVKAWLLHAECPLCACAVKPWLLTWNTVCVQSKLGCFALSAWLHALSLAPPGSVGGELQGISAPTVARAMALVHVRVHVRACVRVMCAGIYACMSKRLHSRPAACASPILAHANDQGR